MTRISDDYMKQIMASMKSYCIVILKPGPNRYISGVEQIKWEHVRRNFLLRFEGKLPIVSPVADGCGISGIGIFNAGIDETRSIMEKDPAVVKRSLFL